MLSTSQGRAAGAKLAAKRWPCEENMRKSFLTTRLFSSSFCCHENGRDRDPDDAVQRRRFKRRVSSSFQDLQTTPVGWWVVLAVAGGLLYGYNVSVAATLNAISSEFHLQTWEKEVVSSAATLVDTSAMLFGGWIADRYGRRNITLFAAAVSTVANLWASSSETMHELILARLCVGLGNGLSILLVPLYVSESVTPENRGSIVAAFQSGVCMGTALPYASILFFGEGAWRVALGIGCFPGLTVFSAVFWKLPESLPWLVYQERKRKRQAYRDLDEDKVTADDPHISDGSARDATLLEIESIVVRNYGSLDERDFEQPGTSNEVEAVRPSGEAKSRAQSSYALSLVLGILLAYSNNSIDVCLFYAPQILMAVGVSSSSSEVIGLLMQLMSWPAMILAFFLVNRLPRRLLLLCGLSVVIVGYIIAWAIFTWTDSGVIRTVFLSSAFAIIIVAYQCGPGTLFVLITPELYSQGKRARSVSLCTFFMSFFSLVINATLLSTFELIGTGPTFLAYSASFTLCFIVFYVYLPETKYRDLAAHSSKQLF